MKTLRGTFIISFETEVPEHTNRSDSEIFDMFSEKNLKELLDGESDFNWSVKKQELTINETPI